MGKLGLGTPTITGTPQVGVELVADAGTWTPGDATFSYQWLRVVGKKTTLIPGAMAPSYFPTAEDVGAKLIVNVMGHAPGYAEASKNSAATAAVVPA